MPHAQSTLKKVLIVHRHGSRGPGANELHAFAPDSALVTQWESGDLERITPVGEELMLNLARWFWAKFSPVLEQERCGCKWRASTSERAYQSGETFTGMVNQLAPRALFPLEAQKDPAEADAFRMWQLNKQYKDALKTMATSEVWISKARETELATLELFANFGFDPYTIPDATARLYATTYACCVLDVERFWPAENRGALSQALSDEQVETTEALARWVWEQRFFKSGFGHVVGGDLAKEIVADLRNPDIHVGVYSGHDYTILSILAALKLWDSYASAPLSFGAYLIFEVREDEEGEFVHVYMNPVPFKDLETGDATADLQDVRLVLVDRAPVEFFEEIVANFPPPPGAAAVATTAAHKRQLSQGRDSSSSSLAAAKSSEQPDPVAASGETTITNTLSEPTENEVETTKDEDGRVARRTGCCVVM